MSNTVYPFCVQCCVKFQLAQRWGRASSGWLQGPWVLTPCTHFFFLCRYICRNVQSSVTNNMIHTHTHKDTDTQVCREAQLQKKKKKNTQKSPDDCLSAEKITVSQKSFSNSYSIVVFSLSGSGASLGIDCQAYCLYHLALYHRTRTHQRWERHVH